jgi:hypothetical protein
MAKPEKGVGILIGVGPKKPASDEGYEESESDDASKEVKRTAVRALMSAITAADEDAAMEALDAYLDC